MGAVGLSLQRKEAWDKVTGAAKYNDDFIIPGILHAKLAKSTYAHAQIIAVDIEDALKSPGVQAVLTGETFPVLCGSVLADRPPLARGKVRYYGEPVAMIVANSEHEAMLAAHKVNVEYEPLPVVNSVREALAPGAPLVHEDITRYEQVIQEVYPQQQSNICHHVQVRKGDIAKGWQESDVIIEASFSMPQADHMAMETRNARAEILPSGEVVINTSTQGPFSVVKLISKIFGIEDHKITVKTPLVGGAFGGKATVQLEILAYMASRVVGGKPVKITNTREDDIVTSPCKPGLEAKIKLGATTTGILKAAELSYMLETGAYADTGPRMAQAVAVDGTGPYHIENVWCDGYAVYTNHPYATSFRGFGHTSETFCIERAMDKLAKALGMDPLELRLQNAISGKATSPTQVPLTAGNVGDLSQCLVKLRELINWQEGALVDAGNGKVRAKGVSAVWKTSSSPTNASSGVLLTFNTDGSLNLNCGAVEIGPGTKTAIAQIVAERLKMNIDRIRVFMDVDTRVSPKHWKTVASKTTFMIGNAALAAAQDLIKQLCDFAATVLNCSSDELDIDNEWVFLKSDPTICIAFKEIALGYKFPDGTGVGAQIIGRGSYMMPSLTLMNPMTGEGKPGPFWTVGAQAVEVEYDPTDYSYRFIRAATVLDAGKVINPKTAKGVVMGGMCMGLGLGSREEFNYSHDGKVENSSLRTYKVMHYGQTPEYLVEFVETPNLDGPYGERGIGEHGILGIPAALANALSLAAGVELDSLPLNAEYIWRTKTADS